MPLHFDHNLTDLSQYQSLPRKAQMRIRESVSSTKTTYTYTVQYATSQRIGRFFQGLGLTFATLCFGLLDQRVRHKWTAAFTGQVVKKVNIASSVVLKIRQDLRYEALQIKAVSAWQHKKFTVAEKLFLELRQENPEDYFNLISLINIYIEVDKLDEAKALCLNSLPKDGPFEQDHAPLLKALGIIYEKKQDTENAKQAFEKAYELDPQDEFIRKKLGK